MPINEITANIRYPSTYILMISNERYSILIGSPVLKVVIPFSPPQYMNSAALSEIAGELLVTVRELREELLQVIF